MYLSHFGLNEPPFRITPHTDFFFEGANRGATLGALLYAISHEEGIIKITGEVGSGKTMLCRVLIERLPVHVETIYLANPSLSRDEILHTIADDLRVSIDGRRTTVLLRALQEDLIKRYAAGKRVVVLIDEAHAMPLETLEEIRLLSNLESNRHKLLHIVLFGQPELEGHLALPNMRQIKERIIHSFRLEPLVRDDVTQYIEFRMRAAGYKGPSLFTRGALRIISKTSEGLTRRVNILSDKALLAAFADGTHEITVKHARAAVRDSEFRRMGKVRSMWGIAAAAAAAGLLVGLFFHYYSVQQSTPVTGEVVAAAPAKPAPVPQTTIDPSVETGNVPAVKASGSEEALTIKRAAGQDGSAVPPRPTSENTTDQIASAGAPRAANPPSGAPVPAGKAPAGSVSPAPQMAAPATGRPESPAPSAPVLAATHSSPPPSVVAPPAGTPAAPTMTKAPALEPPVAPAPAPVARQGTPALPPPSPESPLARSRFIATQAWLKTAPAKTYAIELLTVRSGNSDVLEDFVRQLSQLLDADSVHVYSVRIDDAQYFAVAFGNYATVADTVTAMGQLPETLKARAPYPRSFGRMRLQNQQ